MRNFAGIRGGRPGQSPAWGLNLLRPSDWQAAPGDGSDAGGTGPGGNGQAGSGGAGFTMQDIVNAARAAQPHDYLDLPGQYFNWRDMAVGTLAGQLPLGTTALSILGPGLGQMWSGQIGPYYAGATRSPAEVARGFASTLPNGGLMKLAEWYAGTPYAKAHPVQSYYMGGNADPQAANAADAAYRAGAAPGFMQSVYDHTAAQKNLGGAGYAGIGDDMANTLQAAIDTGTAQGAFLSPGGALLNAVNGSLRGSDAYGPGGHQSYDGLALDMQQTAQSALSEALARGEVPQDLLDQLNAAGLTIDAQGQIANEAAQQGGDGGDAGSAAPAAGGIDSGAESGYGWGYAKGGVVGRPRAGTADPPGPDDQYAAVQSGEGVLSRAAMRRLGPALFDALNACRYDVQALARVLLG